MSNPALPLLFASAINLGVDLSFFAQFALFATFVAVMRPLLFDPLLRVFWERERRTEGAKVEARKMDAQAHEMAERLDARLMRVRQQVGAERDRQRAEAARLEAKIMDEARKESAEIVAVGKARIATEIDELRGELAVEKPKLAAQIASRILAREVRS